MAICGDNNCDLFEKNWNRVANALNFKSIYCFVLTNVPSKIHSKLNY